MVSVFQKFNEINDSYSDFNGLPYTWRHEMVESRPALAKFEWIALEHDKNTQTTFRETLLDKSGQGQGMMVNPFGEMLDLGISQRSEFRPMWEILKELTAYKDLSLR